MITTSPNDAGATTANSGSVASLATSGDANSISFIQSGAGADAETVQDALRREVWADQYKQASDPDDSACITRAVAALLATGGGGIVRLSRRTYVLGTAITFSGVNNVRIIGAGKNSSGTILRENFTTGDGIAFSNCQGCEISGVQFWPAVRKTDGYAVALNNSCFDCLVDIRCDYGWNGLHINGATETRYRILTRHMLGAVGVRFAGTSNHKSYRAVCLDQVSDNPYPMAAEASGAKSFSGGMALNPGDHFVANGAIWQCIVGGTAAAFAPPAYPAGTTPESVFTATVASGTARLKWIANANLTHIVQDSYAYSLVIAQAALINGAFGVRQLDTAATGSSYPIWIFGNDLECDHNYLAGIDLQGGEGFYDGGNCWVSSCQTGNGILIGANYRGCVSLGAGSRIFGNAQHGILREAGALDIRLSGIEVTDNGTANPAAYNGLTIADGAKDTHIVGGRFGNSPSVAGNSQRFGIAIGTACDMTSVIGASVRGNTTGGINIGASQTNLMIKACPGHNPGSITAVTVGGSPFNWTNRTGSDVSLTITGGTTSAIRLDGATVSSATNTQIVVPAGSSTQIIYSARPTVNFRVM